MRRLRHVGRLLFELVAYSFVQHTIWPLLFIALLLILSATVVVGQVALPYMYTIF